jgi:nuclear GTP-binding protein
LEKMAQRTGKLLKGGEPDISTVAKMVLNDWQRGKLPFFVKPPELEGQALEEVKIKKSKKTPVTKIVAEPETEETADGEKSSVVIPSVKQDLTKLSVEPEFEGDDVQALEEDTSGLFVSDNEEEEEDEEEEGEVEGEQEGTGQGEEDKGSDEDMIEFDLNDKPKETESHKQSTSGRFRVTPKRKREDTMDMNPRMKLTSKERRRMEREAKTKKIGTHFYETTNVKNRNRRKAQPADDGLAFRGHSKKATNKTKQGKK